MKRRDFILSTVAGAGVISVSTYYLLSGVEYDNTIAQPKSLSLIWDDRTIVDIGDKYRKQTPDESSERTLVKLLQDQSANENVTKDFESGNTVVVDGWVLSKTEARQCALASTIKS